jgi:acyl-CoA synthetase (AMP-forming)/AMP-acid ligase II
MLLDERGRSLCFGDFRDAAERVAAGLAALGYGRDARISWQLPTGLEACVLTAALARLGAVQNPIVPSLGPREVGFMTRQTRAELLVVAGTWRGVDQRAIAREFAKELGFEVLTLDALEPGPHGLRLPDAEPASSDEPDPAAGPAVRWIYYTSGTTADPKGARHTDQSILAASNAFTHSGWFGADDVAVVPIPMAHIGGAMLLGVLLRTGCQAALVEAFDPVATPRFAASVGATIVIGTAAVFQAYLDAQRAKGGEPLLPRLRVAANGGAPRPSGIHGEIRDTLGGAGTMSGWGLTECPAVTAGCRDDADALLAATEGRPGEGVEVSVVDARGQDCPSGTEGELRLRAPQLFCGYVDSSLDQVAFDRQGRFCTGDLGSVGPGGHVRVTGRLKDVIIRNGENISSLEVEQALSTHRAVRDVAVIGLPDPRTGERCCAVLELVAGQSLPGLAGLGEHCGALGLARYKWPERVEQIDSVPRDGLGKIDKRALRARFSGQTASPPAQGGSR